MVRTKKKIAVVGGGIIGLAIAYKLSQAYSEVSLFEKESSLGEHQSGNNSGVLHCGLYYEPHSLKAKLAVEGIREMVKFCRDYNIPHDICGKILVATNEREGKTLNSLADRGKINGLTGLKFLTAEELKRREPYVKGEKSLLVPEEGIVDYKMVMEKMASLIRMNGGEIHTNSKIKNLEVTENEQLVLSTEDKEWEFDLVINSTGLHADRTYQKLTTKKRPLRIIPFRGEYMAIKEPYKEMVNHLVYPVPDSKYPFLGVHFTRLINGKREVGPNAVFTFKREGYKNSDFSFRDSLDSLSYTGFHKFIKNNFSFVLKEFSSSLSINAFVEKAKKLIPEINENMIEKGNAGVRAQAMDSEGRLIMDFRIERVGNQIHLLNAPSPGATASLAIANYIIEQYIN